MHEALLFIVTARAAAVKAGQIRGTVRLRGNPAGPVEVSFAALTATGEKITNMAGVTIGDGTA